MLTVTCESHFETAVTDNFVGRGQSQNDTNVQVETLPSDAEIARRVRAIRGSWSRDERVERRIEADLRYAELLERLLVDACECDAA